MENGRHNIQMQLQLATLGLEFLELVQLFYKRKRKVRRWWSKPLIRNNYLTGYGGYERVFKYFLINDEEDFIMFTRMNVQQFMYLYDLVRERLIKRSIRPSLPPDLRLSLTLNYLAHADTIKKVKWFNSIGESTVKQVIPEVCNVLCEILAPIFLFFPSPEQFEVIAQEFMIDLHFPHCIGALDGRHCPIKKPPNSGTLFYNYKKYFSIVLMACCDSKKRFTWANIGDYGYCNDAGIFASSDLGDTLARNQLELPVPSILPNTMETALPFFLIGDGIFPLRSYLMKPYLRNDNLTMAHRVFNYRLSHTRRVIENAFGDLCKMWLVNETDLAWKLATSERIILSSMCLHNMLIDFMYNEVGNRWSNNLPRNIAQRNIEGDEFQAFRIREQLCEYFISPTGSVPWQWNRM